jgi:hypothetical protein
MKVSSHPSNKNWPQTSRSDKISKTRESCKPQLTILSAVCLKINGVKSEEHLPNAQSTA